MTVAVKPSLTDQAREHRLALSLLALIVGASFSTASLARATNAAQRPPFTIIGVSTYAPTISGKQLVLRIPLMLRSDISARGLRVELYDVELPGRREAALFSAFSARMEPAVKYGPRAPAVQLRIAEHPPLPAGAYRVRFAVISRRPATQRNLAVTVRLSAPGLATPPPLYIHNSIGVPWEAESDSGLVLRNTSADARLSGLSITQVQAPGGPSQPVGANVTASTPKSIEPNSSRTIHVKTKGDFPIGTATGQLQISSPQLAQPMLVTYQVQTKVWPIYLFLTIAVGVVLGFVTRVWLVQRIERSKALIGAYGLLDLLRRERQRHADADFQKALREASEELESLLAAPDPGEITAALSAATEALASARTKLQADMQKAGALIASLESKLGSPMELPSAVEEVRAAHFRSLETIKLELESGDAATATKAGEELQRQFDSDARLAGERWCAEITPFVRAIAGKEAIDDSAVLGSANPELSANAAAAAKEATTYETGSTPEDLALLHNAVVSLMSTLSLLRPIVAAQMTESMTLAGYDRPRQQAIHDAVWSAAERFKVALASADARRGPTVQELLVALSDLSESLAELIRKKGGRAKKQAVNAALEQGNFIVAAQQSQPTETWFAPDGTSLEVDIALLRKQVNDTLDAGVELSTPSPGAQQPWRSIARMPSREFPETPPSPRQVHALGELARARMLQTILLGLIISVIGYLLLADNFVGTTTDFLSAFAWGYTADITAAFVINALQGRAGQGNAQPAAA